MPQLSAPAGTATAAARRTDVAARRTDVAVVVAIVSGLTAGLALIRFALTAPPGRTVWAEDGSLFLHCQWQEGLGGCLTERVQGYLNVTARLLAVPASWVDPSRAGIALAALTAVAVGLVGGFAARQALRAGLPTAVAVTAGLLPAVIPGFRGEVALSLANIQWFLPYAAFWAVVPVWRDGPSRSRAALDTVVAALAAVGSPLTIATVPVALARIVRVRHSPATQRLQRAAPALGLLVAVTIQASVFLLHRGERTIPPMPPEGWGLLTDFRGALAAAVAWTDHPDPVGWVTGVTIVAAVAVVALSLAPLLVAGCDPAQRIVAVSALLTSLATYVVTVAANGHASRYFYAASVFVALAVVMGVACLIRAGGARRALGVGVATVLVVAWLVRFPIEPYRVAGPAWVAEVRTAQATCAVDQRGTGTINIAPGGSWSVTVPCWVLAR